LGSDDNSVRALGKSPRTAHACLPLDLALRALLGESFYSLKLGVNKSAFLITSGQLIPEGKNLNGVCEPVERGEQVFTEIPMIEVPLPTPEQSAASIGTHVILSWL
jgi:hypothetical protein